MSYDIAAKVVVAHARKSLLRWFTQLEPEEVELLEQLPQETATLRRSDFPLWVRTVDGQERIVLLEFQTRWESKTPLRLAEYVIRFRLKHDVPVQGTVIVFRKRGEIPEVYEDEVLRFQYGVVRLWEFSGRECLEREELGLYPFIPLMRCEDADVFEAAERLYTSEFPRSEKSDLLTAMTFFAGIRGEHLAGRLLRERRDIMSESFVYDIIKREGWQEGHREGLQQGLQQGLLEDARSMVLQAIRTLCGYSL